MTRFLLPLILSIAARGQHSPDVSFELRQPAISPITLQEILAVGGFIAMAALGAYLLIRRKRQDAPPSLRVD